jgi:hypothetical protein
LNHSLSNPIPTLGPSLQLPTGFPFPPLKTITIALASYPGHSKFRSLVTGKGSYGYSSFSPDANFFGAFTGDHLSIWRYTSGHYTQWREFQQAPTPLQFSPTSSSILGNAGTLLYVIHSDHSPGTLAIESAITTHSIPRDAYSPHGNYIATTHRGKNPITITNLCSQNPSPSQFIDTTWIYQK